MKNLIIKNNLKFIEPWSITGFCDGESAFMVNITKQKNGSWKVTPCFYIELHKNELPLLYDIQNFFNGVGNITVRSNRNTALYRILDLQSINNIIIPHFDNYPLLTQKSVDFETFKQIVELINNKAHLSQDGIHSIISLKSTLF